MAGKRKLQMDELNRLTVEDLKKEDPLAFEEFCEDYPEIVKELEL